MTDQPNAPEAGQKPDQAPKPEFQPITSQEQLNALLGDRLARERAKFADYGELRDKASRFPFNNSSAISKMPPPFGSL